MASAPSFHPVQPFLDAIPVDVVMVVGDAIRYRRAGERAADAMKWALQRERAVAMKEASRAWQASLETRMEILRTRVLGKIGYARDRDYSEMAAITRRLAELQPEPEVMLEAAE
jgi:hypothetical protein